MLFFRSSRVLNVHPGLESNWSKAELAGEMPGHRVMWKPTRSLAPPQSLQPESLLAQEACEPVINKTSLRREKFKVLH